MSAKEKAFRVPSGTELHSTYWASKEELERGRKLAAEWVFENFGIDKKDMKFRLSPQLAILLPAELQKKHVDDIKKERTSAGLYVFKVKSTLNKKWVEEVSNKLDFKKMTRIDTWWMALSDGFRYQYALWDDEKGCDGDLYGFISSDGNVSIPKEAEEIKMSEYYQKIEELEGKEK